MPTLSEDRLGSLLQPFLLAAAGQGGVLRLTPTEELLPAVGRYLDLLTVWNGRTNLTAIRDPEEIVRRHFGESLFAARCLAPHLESGEEVLDLGSGAGFPGLPLALLLPELRVTLAESQSKKAAFLREAIRVTGSGAVVWGARTESLPLSRRFAAVTMRAVDNSEAALKEGRRLAGRGWTVQFVTGSAPRPDMPVEPAAEIHPFPGGAYGAVRLSRA